MKYWQEERWQTASRSNVPNLYLYTSIRVGAMCALAVNSVLMMFIVEENSLIDQIFARENIFFMIMILYGIFGIVSAFSIRKVDRTVKNVIVDCICVGMASIMYIAGNYHIIGICVVEAVIITFFSIRIHKNNHIVDHSKIVLWWQHKKQEKFDKEIKKFKEKALETKTEHTDEQKLKKMSRKQRKQYKRKN